MYQLIENSDTILRLPDNAYIPNDLTNSDRIQYEKWVSEGNKPDPVPSKTTDQLSAEARLKRDQLLNNTYWLVERHRNQLDANLTTSITDVEFMEILTYQQELRDVPAQFDFPEEITWPTVPGVLINV